MNITFLVGNGFDINLGLNTRYTDFYPSYLAKGYDNILSRAIKDNYDNWADLEVALGLLLKDVTPDQIEAFLDSKGQLEADLAEYLRKETSRLEVTDVKIPGEFQKHVAGFTGEFSLKEKNDYKNWIVNVKEAIQYRFISYNYTDCLDRIVERVKSIQSFSTHDAGSTRYTDKVGEVFHIHGTLSGDLILGVNDVSQIGNLDLQKDNRLTDYIVKVAVNEALGEQRIENAKRIIDNSDYIAVYGMSLGDTDLMWWQYLLLWLQKKNSRRLILYVYADPSDNPSGQEKLRRINAWKDTFLTKAGADTDIASKLRGQIFVVIRSKIFDFNGISIKEQDPEKVLISV